VELAPEQQNERPDRRARGDVVNATWFAIMLARDVETCRQLLRGEHVDPARLDPKWLARAKALRLVRLDARAIDLFESWPPDQEVPRAT
jgi:hypothetical protein